MKGTKWIALLCASVMACSMNVSAAPFDAMYYAAQNPDVVAAVGNDAVALELHYRTFGANEGRAGNAEDAAVQKNKTKVGRFEEFDAAYYAQQNPDAVSICGMDAQALYTHYVNFGAAEGRMPSAAAKEKAEADKKSHEKSKPDNPYARFASSTNSSSHKSSKKSSSKSEHSSDNGGGNSASQVKHTLSYKNNANGTHDVTCSVSGCTQGHNKTGVTCSNFKYNTDKPFGVHDKICRDCGYSKEESCTVNYREEDEGGHKKYCKVCGHSVSTNHNWVNGKCETCDYVCKHNWENGQCIYDCKGTCPKHTDENEDGKCDECGGTITP